VQSELTPPWLTHSHRRERRTRPVGRLPGASRVVGGRRELRQFDCSQKGKQVITTLKRSRLAVAVLALAALFAVLPAVQAEAATRQTGSTIPLNDVFKPYDYTYSHSYGFFTVAVTSQGPASCGGGVTMYLRNASTGARLTNNLSVRVGDTGTKYFVAPDGALRLAAGQYRLSIKANGGPGCGTDYTWAGTFTY